MNPERLQQIQELYLAARERSTADRQAFLEDACGDDPELLIEVDSLLAQDSQDGPMNTPLGGVAASLFGGSRKLSPGTQLGPYQIIERIGAGGMGEVYKARDTRLGRIVAIKLTNEEFSGRFLREARAISALNHSHICTLYDVGADYLVMELVEGQTLAGELKRGPLPIASVMRHGADIADALAVAHAKGIVHRDLKPANIMITRNGVKILDFGLAKFADSPVAPGTDIDTLTFRNTLVGTPAYMAPEQLEGKDCDARTDIFALGLVLFEMATGSRVFSGDTTAAMVAEIMRCEPRLDELAPPSFRHVVARCLAKSPDDRWHAARDVALELRSQPGEVTDRGGQKDSQRWGRAAWLAAGALLVLVITLTSIYLSRSRPEPITVEFNVPPPPDSTGFAIDVAVAVSPDGSQLGLRGIGRDGKEALWVRPMNSSTARPLAGTAGAMSFFWSPDNRQIAYFADKLRKMDVSGGPSQVLSDHQGVITSNGSWGSTGRIVYGAIADDPSLFRVSTRQNVADRLDWIASTLSGHCYEPEFLPDGRHFLFGYRSSDNKDLAVYLGSIENEIPKRLISGGSHGFYTRPPGSSHGYIIFERNMLLMAKAYDERQAEVTGEAWPISPKPLLYWRAFSASLNGVIAYRAGSPNRSLTWFDRQGKQIGALGFRGDFRQLDLSPDESMVVAASMDESSSNRSNIWVMDLSRGTSARLTNDQANNWMPIWSPDGRRIAFSSSKDGPYNIYARPAFGIGADQTIASSPRPKWASSWSPDGKFLAYGVTGLKTRGDLWIHPVAGGKPLAFLQTEHHELQPQFSPDGRWIAYTSDESGRYEVYVRSFDGKPASGAATRISIDGGSLPKWRRDGKELFFVAPDHNLMAAEVRSSPQMNVATPKPLFKTRMVIADYLVGYAVASNGQRFLINTAADDAEAGPVTVIANWNPAAKH